MKRIAAAVMVSSLWAYGCATTSNVSEMTPKEEARYQAAIEAAQAQQPSRLAVGDTVELDAGRGMVRVIEADTTQTATETAQETTQAAEAAPADYTTSDGRHFEVAPAAYDAFFEQSPATVLSWFELEPIQDGSTLLGYRIRAIRSPLRDVDLRAEDIIIGIDGKMPSSPDIYFERWEAAKQSGSCTINIQRGVERHDLTWHKTAE